MITSLCVSSKSTHTKTNSRSPPQDTCCKQNVVVLPLKEITKKNVHHSAHPALPVTYTITDRQSHLSEKRRAGDVCEPSIHTTWLHTKHKTKLWNNASRTIAAAGSCSACSVQKLAPTLPCWQGFQMTTWWLQQTLQRQRPKILRDQKKQKWIKTTT